MAMESSGIEASPVDDFFYSRRYSGGWLESRAVVGLNVAIATENDAKAVAGTSLRLIEQRKVWTGSRVCDC